MAGRQADGCMEGALDTGAGRGMAAPRFSIDAGLEGLLPEIRADRFSRWGAGDARNGRFENGLAVLEYPWADIELNVFSENMPDGDGYTDRIGLSYFCCVKGIGSGGKPCWSDAGYLDDAGIMAGMDFSGDGWQDSLRRDMEEKIRAAAEAFGIRLDAPNWEGDAHAFDVFSRVNGLG